MKKKIIAAILLSLCIACLSLFAAGCSDNSAELEAQIAELTERNEQLEEENEKLQGSNGDIQGQLEELRQQFEELSASNTLTEEQLNNIQEKISKFIDIDWLNKGGYSYTQFYVEIKPEYMNRVYTVNDFLPVKLNDLKFETSEYIHNSYLVTLDKFFYYDVYYSEEQYFFYAILTIFKFDFVSNIVPLYNAIGV